RIAAIATILTATGAGAALAGGYVAPIIDVSPVAMGPAVATGAPQNWWLALLPLLLFGLLLGSGGGGSSRDNGLTPVPVDNGQPCFGEGTLILLHRGWVPVEEIVTGDRIVTSRGVQTIL